MSSTVTFIRCRLKTRSTFLVKFPLRRGMQILLNSHEHGETLKAFYSMLSLRLNSWLESQSATIFPSVSIIRLLFARGLYIHISWKIFNPFLKGYARDTVQADLYLQRMENIATYHKYQEIRRILDVFFFMEKKSFRLFRM